MDFMKKFLRRARRKNPQERAALLRYKRSEG
nr:MAG TPA: hypothetical protein [Caudoviricetes sp.]